MTPHQLTAQTPPEPRPPRRWPVLAALALAAATLAGCASVPAGQSLAEVQALSQSRTGMDTPLRPEWDQARQDHLQRLLQAPLDADAAVQVALLHNPALQGLLLSLAATDAELAQGSRWANPHLALGRFTEGDAVEITRLLRFDVLGLLTLPARTRLATRQAQQARLRAAQDVVRLATRTRQAWVLAVAARQNADYLGDALDAAAAGAELARRLTRVGNWSALDQARQQALLADTATQLARARHEALAARELLTRLLGLWGQPAADYQLAARLPELPASPQAAEGLETRALQQRLDVLAARAQAEAAAGALGLAGQTGVVSALDLGLSAGSTRDRQAGNEVGKRGIELEVPLPLWDQGQTRQTLAQAQLGQALTRVREVAINARSEIRVAWHGYRTAYDVAAWQRDEVLPLRRFIQDEGVLRYNGMLTSVFELLADARTHVAAVLGSLNALRDFWLADAELQQVLTGGSPSGLAAAGTPAASASPNSGNPGH